MKDDPEFDPNNISPIDEKMLQLLELFAKAIAEKDEKKIKTIFLMGHLVALKMAQVDKLSDDNH